MMKFLESPSLTFLFFVTILIILIFCKFLWSRRYFYLLAARLPGPFALPIIGNGLQLICKKEDVLDAIMEATVPYPSPSRLWVGPRLWVIIKDPDHIQAVLQSSKITKKAFIYSFLEPLLGNGLFTSAGNVHKNHKKMFQPLFSQRSLNGYCHLFQKHANLFVENIKMHVDGPEFDVLHDLHEAAFKSAMDILLEDSNYDIGNRQNIPQYVRRNYDLFFQRVTTFWLHPDFIFKRTSLFKEQKDTLKIILDIIEEVMSSKVPEIIRRLIENDFSETRTPSMLEKIIEMMIEDPDCLTVEESIDHLMTFFATSQDTQSSTIAATCMLLGIHPKIQDLVVAELKEVVGDRRELDITDVSKLKYLEMCIKESMRLFPIAPFIFRDTTEDFKFDKYVIPKDTTVAIAIFEVHRNPNYWMKPEEYYPEHFTPEVSAKRHPYSFIPFSGGPRKCIAQQFSYTNMKIIISTILLNYKLECIRTIKDIKFMTDVSVRPVGGYKIKITKRT